jgi:hypothetical protein
MSIKDFKLTANSIGLLIQSIWKLDLNFAYRVNIVGWREKRSNDQNSLYWKWLGEIAQQALHISNDSEIWHEIFKKFYCPEKVVGPESNPIIIKSTKKLDVGEMCFYLNRIENYCIDRGYLITIPLESEYRELTDRQVQ